MERAVVVVETQEEGSDASACLGCPIAADYAVHGAEVLHLDPAAFTGTIRTGRVLGNDAVEACALVAREPHRRLIGVGGLRGHPDGPAARDRLQQTGSAFGERALAEVAVAQGEEIEEHNRRRCLLGEHAHARRGGMDAQLEGVEVEAVVRSDHHLTIDDAALGQPGPERLDQLRKVALESEGVATRDVDPVAVAKYYRPESIPLRLVEP